MRFTVRRPASAEVSPCCHRPSGGDVACGVHVGIARPRTAGDTPENRLALAVFGRDVPTIRASLRRIRCGTNSSRPAALCCNRATSTPHPWRLISRLSPRFCATRVPGCSECRAPSGSSRAPSSPPTRMVSKRRATSVVAFSTQSRRRSASRARTRAIASLVRARRCDPRRARAKRCCNRRNRCGFASTKTRNTQQLPAGQRHRDRHAAIHTHHAAIARPRDRVGEGGKSDVPAPRAIHCDAVRLHGVGNRARPAEFHPADLGYPHLPTAAVEPFDVARFDSDLPETFMRAGFAPGRATMGAVKEVAHRLGEVPQRLLLHSLRPGRQPVVFSARRGQLGALLVVPGRLAARLPVQLLLDGKIPHIPGMATVFGQYCSLLRAGK